MQQSGNAEHECAGANRGDVFRAGRLPADEIDGLAIADRADDTFDAAGNADQVERRAVRKAVSRQEAQSAIARYRAFRFRRHNGPRLRQAGQHLQRSREIELGEVGEEDKTDSKTGHGHFRFRAAAAAQVETRYSSAAQEFFHLG